MGNDVGYLDRNGDVAGDRPITVVNDAGLGRVRATESRRISINPNKDSRDTGAE